MTDKACTNSKVCKDSLNNYKNHDKENLVFDASHFKKCSKCNVGQLEKDFHRNKSKPDGRESICRKCVSKRKSKSFAKKKRKPFSSARKKPLTLKATVKGILQDDAILDFVKIFEEAYRGLKYEGKI